MFNLLKKRLKNEKGLTLVELLAVFVILGIIAAIAIPAIGNIIENSKGKADIADAINVLNAANIYYSDNPDEGNIENINKLIDGGYLNNSGNITVVSVTKGTPLKITFTDHKGNKHENKSLKDLNDATVKKGVINWKE